MASKFLRQLLQHAVWKSSVIELHVLSQESGRFFTSSCWIPRYASNETDWSAAVPLTKSYSPYRSLDSGKTSMENYEVSCWDGHSRKLPEAKLDGSIPQLTHSAMHFCMSSSPW